MTAHPKNHLQEGTGLLSQIEHLDGREKALEPLGWTGTGGRVDRSGVSAQRRLHAGAVLFLF